jgi:(p)ppGpp synthase/HD superfamily hydrolase
MTLHDAARAYAETKHAKQKYGKEPYMTHVYAVADKTAFLWNQYGVMFPEGFSMDTTLSVAYLHDTVEDTNATVEELESLFGSEVAEAVSLLTKDKSLSYRENIQRIVDSGNLHAILVKLADNSANLAGDKSGMSLERAVRLNRQYKMSIKMLSLALIRAV